MIYKILRSKWMDLVLAGVILAWLLVSLTGCAPCPFSGTITGKGFVPAHTNTTYMPIYHKIGSVTMVQYLPMTNYVPDRWYVDAKDAKDDYQFTVTKADYDRYQVGDTFSRTCQK